MIIARGDYKSDEVPDYPHVRKVQWEGKVSREVE
jgi:hypothetical protein